MRVQQNTKAKDFLAAALEIGGSATTTVEVNYFQV